jgi:hypothetical protein
MQAASSPACDGVSEFSPSAGAWTEQVVYSVSPNFGGPTIDAAGDVFGTGTSTAFELSPNGSGGWNGTTIHTLAGPPKDGSNPYGDWARAQSTLVKSAVSVLGPAVFLRFGSLTIAFQRARVKGEVASTSFRFPETKSAHLKFSPLSDYNLRRLPICLHAMSLSI